MVSNRRPKRMGLIALLLLAVLVGSLGWMVCASVRQERLDHALIAAIKRNDTPAVLSLLAEGADPNALDIRLDTRPIWRQLWDRVRNHTSVQMKARAALLLEDAEAEDLLRAAGMEPVSPGADNSPPSA